MKVWLQQVAFVDYRERIFGLIADSLGGSRVTFLGGQQAREKGLNVIETIHSRGVALKVSLLKNRFLPAGLCWQSGILLPSCRSDYDAIILQGDLKILSNWIVQLVALIRGKRVLLWTHGLYGDEGKLKSFFRHLNLRMSSGILLYGNYARKLLEARGFDSERLYVVYNSSGSSVPDVRFALDKVKRKQLRDTLFPQAPESVLSFIGRLTSVKRLDILIEALAKLHRESYSVGLLIIGDGPLRPEMERSIAELGLSNYVHFYGTCYDKMRTSELMSLTDVCVSPGNVGLTAMSAMEVGVPVITHGNASNQMPEYEAIEPGETGDFFEEGDVNDLASVLADWLDGNKSNEANRDKCFSMIKSFYNPAVQIEVVKGAICGAPASRFPRRNFIPVCHS